MKQRMNKRIALAAVLSAVLVMGTVTGCSQKKESIPESGTGTESQKNTEETVKTGGNSDVKGTPITLKLFSMICPEGWTENEEEKSDEDRIGKSVIDIMDGEESLVNLRVCAYEDSASAYRDLLRRHGVDAYEMVENDAYPKKNIGGIDLVETEDGGGLYYIGRDEASGKVIVVQAYGDVTDPRLEEAISTVSFTLPDLGMVDPPWPWNGERYTTDKEHSVMVADKTIKAEFIPFDEPVIADSIFSGRAEIIGNSLWVLMDGKLFEYAVGDPLTLVKEVELPGDGYEEISSDVNGNLYATRFMRPMLTIKDGTIIASNDGVDNAIIDQSGTFGISYFFNNVPKKVTISDNIASVSEWAFIEKEKVDQAGLTTNSMYVTGEDAETDNNVLWIYDKEGNLKMSLGNVKFPELGSIASLTDVIETDTGFMALDGNARKLLLWNTEGTLIGEVEDDAIFGTRYPWISTATLADDGTIYIGLVEARTDKSADEFVIYRLSGF